MITISILLKSAEHESEGKRENESKREKKSKWKVLSEVQGRVVYCAGLV